MEPWLQSGANITHSCAAVSFCWTPPLSPPSTQPGDAGKWVFFTGDSPVTHWTLAAFPPPAPGVTAVPLLTPGYSEISRGFGSQDCQRQRKIESNFNNRFLKHRCGQIQGCPKTWCTTQKVGKKYRIDWLLSHKTQERWWLTGARISGAGEVTSQAVALGGEQQAAPRIVHIGQWTPTPPSDVPLVCP